MEKATNSIDNADYGDASRATHDSFSESDFLTPIRPASALALNFRLTDFIVVIQPVAHQ